MLATARVVAVALGVHVQASARAPLEALAEEGATARLVGRVAGEPRPAAFGEDLRWVLSVQEVTARAATTRATASVEVTAPPPAPAYGATASFSARLQARWGETRVSLPMAALVGRLGQVDAAIDDPAVHKRLAQDVELADGVLRSSRQLRLDQSPMALRLQSEPRL